MSIRVSAVQNEPIKINRTKLLLTDVDRAKKEEWDRRRKLRLQQVRQQSRDIAQRLRTKVAAVSKAVEKDQEDNELQELKDFKQKQMLNLQKEFDKCLKSVGSAHKSASLQPDPKSILKEQKIVMDAVAKARGRLAEEKEKKEKQKAVENAQKAAQKLNMAREIEKLRSAMVTSLPPVVNKYKKKSPKKTKSPKKSPVKSPVSSFQNRSRNLSLTLPDDDLSDDSDDSSVTWPPRRKIKVYNHNERKATELPNFAANVTKLQENFDMRLEMEKENAERAEYELMNKQKIEKLDKRGKIAVQKEQSKKEFDEISGAISILKKQEKIQKFSAPPDSQQPSTSRNGFKNQDRLEELLKKLQETPEKCPKLFNPDKPTPKRQNDLKLLSDKLQKQRKKLLDPNDRKILDQDSSEDEIDLIWADKKDNIEKEGQVLPHYDPRPEKLDERKCTETLKIIDESEKPKTNDEISKHPKIVVEAVVESSQQNSSSSTSSSEVKETRKSWPESHVTRRPLNRLSSSSESFRKSFESVENVYREKFQKSESETSNEEVKVVVRIKGNKTPKKKPIPVEKDSSSSYYSPPSTLSPEQHSILSSVLRKLAVKNKNPKLHDYIIELLNKSKNSINNLGVSSSDVTLSGVSDVSTVSGIRQLSSDSIDGSLIENLVRRIEKLTDLMDDSFLNRFNESQTSGTKKGRFPALEDSVRSQGHYIVEEKKEDVKIDIPDSLHPLPFQEEPTTSFEAPCEKQKKHLSTILEVDTPITFKERTVPENDSSFCSSSSSLVERFRRLKNLEDEKEPDFESTISTIADCDLLTEKDVESLLESSDEGIEEVFRSLGIGWALSTLRKTRERNKRDVESSSSSLSQSRNKKTNIRHSTPIKPQKSPKKSPRKKFTKADSLTPPSVSLNHPSLK